MAEQMAGPDILHVKPAGRKSYNRDHEFPAVVAAIRRKRLDGNPGAGLGMSSVDVQNFVIQEVDDIVGRLTVPVSHGTCHGQEYQLFVWIRSLPQNPPLPWTPTVVIREDPTCLRTSLASTMSSPVGAYRSPDSPRALFRFRDW